MKIQSFSIDNRFESFSDKSIADQGCNMNENFAIIVHGWLENVNTTWVNKTVSSLLQYRGGCVFFMDYSKYSTVWKYFDLVPHFEGLSALLLKKFKQIGNYDQQFCYGFSFGARLCVDAGINVGQQLIGRMDLCELTGNLSRFKIL
jgi:hypothetical protein